MDPNSESASGDARSVRLQFTRKLYVVGDLQDVLDNLKIETGEYIGFITKHKNIPWKNLNMRINVEVLSSDDKKAMTETEVLCTIEFDKNETSAKMLTYLDPVEMSRRIG